MPFYDYICQKCHHTLEAFQRMDDLVLTKCPKCGEESLIRCLNIPYVHIKQSDGSMTLGSLAEKNAKNMSQEQKEILDKKHKRNKKKPSVIPWYEQGMDKPTKKKIAGLKNKKEVTEYVEFGKLPS